MIRTTIILLKGDEYPEPIEALVTYRVYDTMDVYGSVSINYEIQLIDCGAYDECDEVIDAVEHEFQRMMERGELDD